MKRVHSIDITRGIVMVIMALDHVRDLMHVNSITQSPTNLDTTTPSLFFTRWITHLCAPAFVFLAGTSVYLSLKKAQNVSMTRSFLLKRGIYLLALEFLVVNFAIFFDIGFHILLFEVIAAIGFGFIVLALLLKVSLTTIGIIGLVILFFHNLFPLIPFDTNSSLKTGLNLLFTQTVVPLSAERVFVMAYPPIPWLGIMLVGFAAGKFFEQAEQRRKRLFTRLGITSLLLFIALRFINIYGDAVPWASQKNALFTFLSFINVTKYPPSLQFCLITLGIMLLTLAMVEGIRSRVLLIVSVYGKVPFFYFILHFILIHLLMLGLMFLQGFSWAQMEFTTGTFGRPRGIQSGVNLWAIYLIWIGVVALLYKPCLWYGKYKSTHQQWWLKYI